MNCYFCKNKKYIKCVYEDPKIYWCNYCKSEMNFKEKSITLYIDYNYKSYNIYNNSNYINIYNSNILFILRKGNYSFYNRDISAEEYHLIYENNISCTYLIDNLIKEWNRLNKLQILK